MEMVSGWTGRAACALQSGLRMGNQKFAAHLETGLRTVADWQKPDMPPQPEAQRMLAPLVRMARPLISAVLTLEPACLP